MGIGTTSPSRALDVSGKARFGGFGTVSSASNAMVVIDNASYFNNPIEICENNNLTLQINTSRNIGLGGGDGVRAARIEYGTRNVSVTEANYPATLLFSPRGLATTTPTLFLGFTGRVGIGNTSPTAMLHLKAGTASTSTAPLKFTAGTNLTTPEDGAMEFDGSNFEPSHLVR